LVGHRPSRFAAVFLHFVSSIDLQGLLEGRLFASAGDSSMNS
jgi:hypothetical protein